MQIGLTNNVYDKYKIKPTNKKPKNKVIISSIFIVIFVVVVLIFAFYPRYYDSLNNEYEIYFVVADSNISQSTLQSVSSRVEDYGGAGVVADLDDYKNAVIIFAYYNLNDAEKINDSNKYIFQNSTVKSIKIEKLSKNLQTKIQNESGAYEIYEFYYNEKYNSHNKILEFEKGNISFNELYDYAYKLKYQLFNLQKQLGNGSLSENLYNSINKLINILDTFMENNLKGDYSSLYFKKFVVNLILEEIYIKTDIL